MQQVNLLSPELMPKSEPMLGRQLALVWGAFAAVLAVFSMWQGVSLVFLEEDLAAVEAEVRAIDAANRSVKESERQDVASAINDLERLRREHTERNALVEILSGYRRTEGFSGHLKSLARSHVEGLWLSEIRIDHTVGQAPTIMLKGAAEKAQRVPDYIHNLAADQYLAGQRFDRFQLSIDEENELVQFELIGPEKEGS